MTTRVLVRGVDLELSEHTDVDAGRPLDPRPATAGA